MNLVKKLAVKILKKELAVDTRNFRALEEQVKKLEETVRDQQTLLDKEREKQEHTDVKMFRDMHLLPEERELCQELAKNGHFANILDKLTMRLVYHILGRTNPTEDDLKLVAGQRAAYAYLLSVLDTSKDKESVDPRTGEPEIQ